MLNVFKLPKAPRFAIAGLLAMAGLLVSIAMFYQGGPSADHLPVNGFHSGAFIGAGLAGLLLADGFGGHGRLGWLIAFGWFVLATFIGSGFGASVSVVIELLASGNQGIDTTDYLQATVMSPVLGWIAVLDGVLGSIVVLITWLTAFAVVHLVSKQVKDKASIKASLKPF